MGHGAALRRMLAAVLLVLTAAGCVSGTDAISPAGVDELVIPTPSPDPDDFVATIDNPWLPLAVGSTWNYQFKEVPTTGLAVTVTDGPTIAGVATTAVRSVSGPAGAVQVDHFAQDTDGNVWWFGREGEWRAGDDGAEAGIAMLADPRLGDGYTQLGQGGVPQVTAEIVALDAAVQVPVQAYTDVLVIETTTAATADVVRNHYVRGTGLVLRETGDTELQLIATAES